MKQAIVLMLLIFVAANSFAHQTPTSGPLTKADYLQKSKHQKTAAWIMLGAGAAMFAIAAPGDVSFDAAGVLVIGGAALVLGSIPLFIAASNNKKKALHAAAFFKMKKTPPIAVQRGFAENLFPAVSLHLTYGHHSKPLNEPQ
jgi:hypothetical protein